jgi:hypothetical protein
MGESMHNILDWVRGAPEQALASLGVALLLALTLSVVSLVRLKNLAQQQQRLLAGLQSGDLEKLLTECLSDNKMLWTQLDARRRAEEVLEGKFLGSLQRVGLIRYDAVANTGGQQSFSLALLDGAKSGVVLSGLQTRAEMRLYAKSVEKGASPATLTDEEKQAIVQASVDK